MNITFEQAKAIIKDRNRLVLDINDKPVFFGDTFDDREALFYYRDDDDDSYILIEPDHLYVCKWTIDGSRLNATLDDKVIWTGYVWVWPESEEAVLVTES